MRGWGRFLRQKEEMERKLAEPEPMPIQRAVDRSELYVLVGWVGLGWLCDGQGGSSLLCLPLQDAVLAYLRMETAAIHDSELGGTPFISRPRRGICCQVGFSPLVYFLRVDVCARVVTGT